MKKLFVSFAFLFTFSLFADDSVQGTYHGVFLHEGKKVYQLGDLMLRTIQGDQGTLKISATVKIFFGNSDSNEFLTYEYDTVSYNWITGQMSMRNDKSDVSLNGIFKPQTGTFEGDWFSSFIGKVGKFSAKRSEVVPPQDGILVKTLTGHYRGSIKNTNPNSNLPENGTMSLVTTQDTSGATPVIKISGSTRFYFGPTEYIEAKLTDINFNFYNRYLTARAAEHGLTFKGSMSLEGVFSGIIYTDGLGEAATTELKRFP